MVESADGWLRVPVGRGSGLWATRRHTKKVLVVAHTVTSTARLLDVLTVIERDPRVQVLFTVIPASAFDAGVASLLDDIGARVIPWDQAVDEEFDLALTAGNSGELHRIKAPSVIMPHGMGYNKYLKTENGKRKTVYGLAAEQLLHKGEVVAASIVLSHPEQLERLRGECPEAVSRATVAGDPCLDRMDASLPWRERYRAELGLRAEQRLVVVASTWGENSLFADRPELLGRLLANLPFDRCRVAAVVHPNVWYGHGTRQVRRWLDDCRRSGLILIPPREGWRAAVVASDCVVGDHGSVTLYAAALGRPVALAGYNPDAIAPVTAMAALADRAPRLDAVADIETVMDEFKPGRYDEVSRLAVARRGSSFRVLRALLYELMCLDEPDEPPQVLPVPPASPGEREWGHPAVPALQVTACVGDAIRLERFPIVLSESRAEPLSDPHLVVDDTETDDRLRQMAQVLVRRAESPGMTGAGAPEPVFAAHPACRCLADVDGDRCVVRLRDGRSIERALKGRDPALLASAVFAWAASGRPLTDLPAIDH
ncbi:hypothetical protein [Spirillospora sp. CA-294931]|uniref:hypothetical protein n=1 Tax=Spirillospora sp. CA-294931 TaxID=3240042 RepID=UPI003D9159BB